VSEKAAADAAFSHFGPVCKDSASQHLPAASITSSIDFAYRAADAGPEYGKFAAFLDSQEFNWRVSPFTEALSCIGRHEKVNTQYK
jgi:hypothetical protein